MRLLRMPGAAAGGGGVLSVFWGGKEGGILEDVGAEWAEDEVRGCNS